MATNTIQNTTPKYRRGQNPNSKRNLKPFTVGTEKEQRKEAGKKSAQKRAEFKNQMEIMQFILKGKVKDIPLSPDRINQMCEEVGITPQQRADFAHVGTIYDQAVHGNFSYSKTLLGADGSDKPQAVDVAVGDIQVNLLASDKASRVAEILKHGIKDLDDNGQREGI